jgi:hypothetical protein
MPLIGTFNLRAVAALASSPYDTRRRIDVSSEARLGEGPCFSPQTRRETRQAQRCDAHLSGSQEPSRAHLFARVRGASGYDL